MKRLLSHHLAWLKSHDYRSEEWLLGRLADGFHVHHLDEDHSNDDPRNLILIEGHDHLAIFHGMKNVKLHIFDPTREGPPSPAAVARGRLGGIARAKTMSKRARQRAASHAARKRWEQTAERVRC
jgi:hypothetical protein